MSPENAVEGLGNVAGRVHPFQALRWKTSGFLGLSSGHVEQLLQGPDHPSSPALSDPVDSHNSLPGPWLMALERAPLILVDCQRLPQILLAERAGSDLILTPSLYIRRVLPETAQNSSN